MPSDSRTVPLSQLDADESHATLLVVHRGKVQHVPVETTAEIVVGRGEDATIQVADRGLSRRHVMIRVNGPVATVTDLESSNGTLLRGSRLEPNIEHRLPLDVPIVLGETRLVLHGPTQSVERGPHATAVETVRRLAGSLLNVLLVGERGAGKRHLASMLHRLSPRRSTDLVEVDLCARTFEPRGVLPGQTLLLSRIDALRPLEQDRLVAQLGATRNVRLLGTVRASSADGLQPALRRVLGEVEIVVPALGEVGDELDEIAQRLAAETAERMQLRTTPQFDDASLVRLREHRFTDGFRELRAVIEGAVARCDGQAIRVGDLELAAAEDGLTPEERRERERIVAALNEYAGNQSRAAKALGISRGTLVSRLKKYDLRRPRK